MCVGRVFKALGLGLFLIAALGVVVLAATVFLKTPRHDRNWKVEHAILPKTEFTSDTVTIKNVRSFSYGPDGGVIEASYYDGTYDLSKLTGVWYGISHFYGFGLAHTFLSFGFEDGKFLTISVEARQEVGETYHPIDGLMGEYELIYVIGDERDIIGLRSHIREEAVYLYEVRVSNNVAREVLVELLAVVNEIYERPRFYNTLTDNCTSSLMRHARRLSFWNRNFNYKLLLPGYSDELAYDLGIIANDQPLQQVRAQARVDPNSTAIEDPNFSRLIRGL